MKHVKQSFTLVEILVVIVIIGILSSFIFFTINDSVDKANIAKSKMFSESIRNNLLLNLVSEWTFDTGTTTAGNTATNNDVKDAWGSNNGTIVGDPIIRGENDCISGKCLDFNGDDYIYTPHIEATNAITVCGWANFSSGTYSTIMGNWQDGGDGDSWLLVTYDTEINFFIRKSDNASGYHIAELTSPQYNEWNHYCGIFNNGYIAIYKNGEIANKDSNVGFTELYQNDYEIWIGRYGDTRYMKGKLDELQIYDSVVSDAEIKQIYLSKLNNFSFNNK
jgi:prepilin-type N-terminal cleavage/methylation domain-containing protein